MTTARPRRSSTLRAQFDPRSTAVLDELIALHYAPADRFRDSPPFVRAASALRRMQQRLVIVQDDVDAFAVRDASRAITPVPLSLHASGRRSFDDSSGNKHDKKDLEACLVLADGRLVAFGSGSTPVRECLVVWDGAKPPRTLVATSLYARLRSAVGPGAARLNIEGAVACATRLLLFHRGNDGRAAAGAPNAILELDLTSFVRSLDAEADELRVECVRPVDLGEVAGVPFGFTDAAALSATEIVVLACAEDSASAVADGPVLGCRVGLLTENELRTVDVCDASGARTTLKLEGIEVRRESAFEFDVVVDIDSSASPAQLGRLTWARE